MAMALPRVIVADDHRGVLQATAGILTRQFDVVSTSSSGEEVVDAAARLHPDVVVLDLSMPGLDGLQAAERIRASGSSARVVFLSNYESDEFVLAALSRGASGFVIKRRMERDLLTAVDHALAGRRFLPSAAVIPQWSRPGSRLHDVQLYTDDAALCASVLPFLEQALHAGHALLVVASASHVKALDAAFAREGIDAAALIAKGSYTIVDSADALSATLGDGMPDPAKFANAFGPVVDRALRASTSSPPHVTMFGEVAPILWRRGEFDAALALERVADAFFATKPITVLCAYPIDAAPGADNRGLSAVFAEHSAIVPSL
jgi:CheY-like chemotaxis protein